MSGSPGVDSSATETPAPRAPAPAGSDVLIAVATIVGVFILLIVAMLLISGREADWGMPAQLALGNGVLLAGIGALLARHRGRFATLIGLAPLGGRQALIAVLVGAVAGLALAVALHLLQTWTGLPIHASHEKLLDMVDLMPSEIVMLALLAGVTTPFIEELVFRGVLFGWLRRRLGPWLGALVSAIPFGLLHLPAGQAVWATLFGMLLALLYQRFGSLWASMLAHSANNLLAVALIATAVEGVPT